MRIGFDVDGVLADFNASFVQLVKEQTGVQLPELSDHYPAEWDYHLSAGVSREQDSQLWKHITESFNFWMRLSPLAEGARIMKALAGVETAHDVYFITSRPGATAKFQTEAWLLKFFALPTVLIAKDKGPLVKSLKLELFVDDKPENCNEVVEATDGKCITLMPDRPYNRNRIVDYRVKRVKNLEGILEKMLWSETMPLGRLVA